MELLELLELCNHGLSVLKVGKRDQVSVQRLNELVMTMGTIKEALSKDEHPMIFVRIDDMLTAVQAIQSLSSIKFLTDNMKSNIADAVLEVKAELCVSIVNYYDTHDFEPTTEIIRLMRDAVATYLERGDASDI